MSSARQAGERAGDRHRADEVLLHVDPAVRGRVGIEADGPHLVAERRAVDQRPEDDERGDGDEEADVEPLEALRRPRRPGAARCWRSGSTPDSSAGSSSGADRRRRRARTPVERDPVEHDRRDHLVGADRRLEDAGDARPRRAGERRADDASRMCGSGLMPAKSTPSQFATIRPTMYWPWPPMLNIPQRKANATARPVRMSVVVCSSVCERLYAGGRAGVFVVGWKIQFRPAPSKMSW